MLQFTETITTRRLILSYSLHRPHEDSTRKIEYILISGNITITPAADLEKRSAAGVFI